MRRVLFSSIFLLACFASAHAQPVPTEYQAMYNTLSADISTNDATLNSIWDHSKFPFIQSAQLQSANSEQTTNLLLPTHFQYNVLAEMNELQALGAKAYSIHISFPAMYEPFYSNPADYQAYLAFYTQVVNEIRARGMKLIVQTTVAVPYPGNNADSFAAYYQSLDWPTYQSQRAQLAANIAQLFHPDYLVLVDEPDTEANSTGQVNAGTVNGSTQMLQGMIAAVQHTGVTDVQLSAGCGAWNHSFLQFIESFATLPLNLLDIHIYPINDSELPKVLTAITLIHASGKQPTMSENWLNKETDAEYEANLPYQTVYARNAYSFWAPLDMSFLQLMSDLANYGHFAFIAPYWSNFFNAYLDYSQYGTLPPDALSTASEIASVNAQQIGAYTNTGNFFEKLLIKPVDKTPPATPAAPTGSPYSQTGASISWTATTDNIGVAGYNLYRGSAVIATMNGVMTYVDTTLSADTTYSYTVQAFDAAGNKSAHSAPLTFTTYSYPDTLPPTQPIGVVATATSDIAISLAWIPSTDNVAISGYEIYRGSTPTSIVPYSTSHTNSFADSTLYPKETFYYQIDAYDTTGNHSARSAVVTATTLADLTPPTVPGNVAAIALTGPPVIVSWTASTDAFPIYEYEIFRGTSSTSLQLIAGVTAAQLTYSDTLAVANRTYFYAVAAIDVYGNISAQSSPVSITVPIAQAERRTH